VVNNYEIKLKEQGEAMSVQLQEAEMASVMNQ
jgi:hypothetical protein